MPIVTDKLGRRTFLKLGGVAAATAGVSAATGCSGLGSAEHTIAANVAGTTQWNREAGEWIPSCCNMCGGQSGILVHVVNGVVEKIEPNHWNPNNYSNISSDFFDGYTCSNHARSSESALGIDHDMPGSIARIGRCCRNHVEGEQANGYVSPTNLYALQI